MTLVSEKEYFDHLVYDPDFMANAILIIDGVPQPCPDGCIGVLHGQYVFVQEWQ